MSKGQRQKRYQFFGRNGIEWTEWYDYDGEEYPWQLKPRLRNEYRDAPSTAAGEPQHKKRKRNEQQSAA